MCQLVDQGLILQILYCLLDFSSSWIQQFKNEKANSPLFKDQT